MTTMQENVTQMIRTALTPYLSAMAEKLATHIGAGVTARVREALSAQCAEAPIAQPKRRGRPPKSAVAEQPKRRGRPPKSETATAPKAARPRKPKVEASEADIITNLAKKLRWAESRHASHTPAKTGDEILLSNAVGIRAKDEATLQRVASLLLQAKASVPQARRGRPPKAVPSNGQQEEPQMAALEIHDQLLPEIDL